MVYALHHPKKPKNCALDSTISPSIQYQKYPNIIHKKSLKKQISTHLKAGHLQSSIPAKVGMPSIKNGGGG